MPTNLHEVRQEWRLQTGVWNRHNRLSGSLPPSLTLQFLTCCVLCIFCAMCGLLITVRCWFRQCQHALWLSDNLCLSICWTCVLYIFPFTLHGDMVLRPWSQDHNLWSWSWSWPLTAPRQNLLVHHLFHPSPVRNGRVHPVLLTKLAICHISQTKTPAWTDVCCLPWSPATLMWWRMGDFRTGTQWTTNLHHRIHPLINILCVRHVDPSWESLAGVIVCSRVAELCAISIFAV